jgi:hypothetical protein
MGKAKKQRQSNAVLLPNLFATQKPLLAWGWRLFDLDRIVFKHKTFDDANFQHQLQSPA